MTEGGFARTRRREFSRGFILSVCCFSPLDRRGSMRAWITLGNIDFTGSSCERAATRVVVRHQEDVLAFVRPADQVPSRSNHEARPSSLRRRTPQSAASTPTVRSPRPGTLGVHQRTGDQLARQQLCNRAEFTVPDPRSHLHRQPRLPDPTRAGQGDHPRLLEQLRQLD